MPYNKDMKIPRKPRSIWFSDLEWANARLMAEDGLTSISFMFRDIVARYMKKYRKKHL
jgi:hypothetical protein